MPIPFSTHRHGCYSITRSRWLSPPQRRRGSAPQPHPQSLHQAPKTHIRPIVPPQVSSNTSGGSYPARIPSLDDSIRRASNRRRGTMMRRETEIVTEESRPMGTLQDVEQMLSQLTRAEKAQVLQWIVRDLADAFP